MDDTMKYSEMPNSSDSIYRQAAIDALADMHCKSDEDGYVWIIRSDAWARIDALPSVTPKQRWIPCSERLPEESGRYLVSVLVGVGRRTTVAPYQPRYKAWTMTGRMAYWKVIAWMPLPESYRGANE